MTELKSRRIKFLRCHIEPGVGAMPKNAFNFEEMGAHAEITAIGVYIKLKDGQEHLVPFSNIQAIKLLPEQKSPKTKEPEPKKEPETPPAPPKE